MFDNADYRTTQFYIVWHYMPGAVNLYNAETCFYKQINDGD